MNPLSMLDIQSFNYSDEDFTLLMNLQDKLYVHPWKNWDQIEMSRYHMELIPAKCNLHIDFIKHNGNIIGWGHHLHDPLAYDPYLLDSILELPSEKKYQDCAEQYLEYQIETAKKLKVKFLRAFQHESREWAKDLYKEKGFEISFQIIFSGLSLNNFSARDFPSLLAKFNKSTYIISTLKELKKTDNDWLKKTYDLESLINQDVPSAVGLYADFDSWKARTFHPWLKDEDLYLLLDGSKWVAMSSYERSDRSPSEIFTGFTGVLPEYRRKGICNALKIHALEDLKKKGFAKVLSSNEKNNPMYKINLKLGFKKVETSFSCKLPL